MLTPHCPASKYASMLYRLSQLFYDRELESCRIGGGQQFFLIRIYEQPGVCPHELALLGRFDKGTATRAVKRLVREGYVRMTGDKGDKRVRRLFVTQEAIPIIKRTYQALDDWNRIITKGMPEAETRQAERLMEKMAENAYIHMKGNRKKD